MADNDFGDVINLTESDVAVPEVDPSAKVLQLMEERREYRREQEAYLPTLLKDRADQEARLSKTARENVALLQKKVALAQEALVIDFMVGGYGPLQAGELRSAPGLKLGTAELWLGANLVAIRSAESPLAPVFVTGTRHPLPEVQAISDRIQAQARTFMKAVLTVPAAQILTYRQ